MIEQLKAISIEWESRQKKIQKHLDEYPDVCSATAAQSKCIANTYKRCLDDINTLIKQYDTRNQSST